jgi:hypothetical protein
MSYHQESLSAFDQSASKPESGTDAPNESTDRQTSDSGIGENTGFESPETGYPEATIRELATRTVEPVLCTEDGTVNPKFSTIAGVGGMAAARGIENPETVCEIVEVCIGHPVIVTGGGMGTPMGSGAIYGRLAGVTTDEETVQVTVKELYEENGRSCQQTQTRTLGAYQLSVPATHNDCADAVTALSQWEKETIDYLNPVERQKHDLATTQQSVFEDLTPGDTVDTPVYVTTLKVVSHPFETYAIIPRGTLSERTVSVCAVTVSNPRGGYYQIGIEDTASGQRYSSPEVPSCYLSGPSTAPPTPNTAFTRDTKFASTDTEVTSGENPPDAEVVSPDEDVLSSSLPEPRLQTPLVQIDGIGEKTAFKIRRATEQKVSAESVASALYGSGKPHTESVREIKSILDKLPSSAEIYRHIEEYEPQSGGI